MKKYYEQMLQSVVQFFSITIFYYQLLAALSFFTFSCGLLNLIGHEPYTGHLILVGGLGLFISGIAFLYHQFK